jgi:hypothetical protein
LALSDGLKVLHICRGDGEMIMPENIISFSPAAAVFYKGEKPQYINKLKPKKNRQKAPKADIAEGNEARNTERRALTRRQIMITPK